MAFAYVFNSKIMNYETETNRTPFMAPETRGGGTLILVVLFEAFFEEDVC